MVKLAFEVAESKGVNFDGIESGGDFISQLGAYWQENKGRLKQMTESQTKSELRKVVEQ